MKRPERILHLIALFLGSREPLSFQTIQELFPEDYGQGDRGAAQRMFERDKVTLNELGITLEYIPARQEFEAEPEGYRLCHDRWRTGPILDREERAALLAAGRLALESSLCIDREELANALRKIALSDPDPFSPEERWDWIALEPHVATPEEQHHLDVIWRALIDRKKLWVRYAGTDARSGTMRWIDPWALYWSRGAFVLRGFCHLRKTERTFLVSRMHWVEANAKRSRSPDFELPSRSDLDPCACLRHIPWMFPAHPLLSVQLSLDRPLVPFVDQLFPGSARLLSEKNRLRLWLEVSCLENLIAHVLRQGPGVRILAPNEAIERLRSIAMESLRAHGVSPVGQRSDAKRWCG